VLWIAIESALGWLIWARIPASPSFGIPIVVTSAVCALRCQRAWITIWDRFDELAPS